MAFRIVFQPYDHNLLTLAAGTGDAGSRAAVERFAAEQVETFRRDPVAMRRAADLALSVIDDGFPARTDEPEEPHRRDAAELLVRAFLDRRAATDREFRYFDLLDAFPAGFFEPFPQVRTALEEGRPWFGAACPEERTYGTLTRDEVRRFAARCDERRTDFAAPEWDVDPLRNVLRPAADRGCDLWFTL
ncbi:hypothetical protein [Alienimonas sp. DA493]|uniref:hypothetical protein n=1 Tax=Alienimonas sp. DA493 TaxID=3373605 RepID=UPI00375427C1